MSVTPEIDFTPTNGLVEGLSMAAYRAVNGVSASDLKNLQRSPAYAHMRYHVTTPAMEWGTAIHTAILEPETLDARYRLDPESPKGGYPAGWRRSNAYNAAKDEALSEPGVEGVLTSAQFQDLGQIQKRVLETEIGSVLTELEGMREASGFLYDEDFGFWRKVRPDYLIPAANMVIDVKSSKDHRPGPFARACNTYGYMLSDAYYRDTLTAALDFDVDHYVYLVVNSDAPFEIAAYTLDEDSVEQGRHDYKRGLAEWRECEETGRWPGGSHNLQEIRLPEYAITYHTQEMV